MTAIRHTTRWKKTDLAFLALALGVHCAVLFTPLSPGPRRDVPSASVTIQLVPHFHSKKAEIVAEAPPLPATQPTPSTPLKPAGELSAAQPALQSVPVDPEMRAQTATDVEHMNTARLVDQVSRMSFTDGQPPTRRQMGSDKYHKQAPLWRTGTRPGALSQQANTFDGIMAPGKTELVDQWQAADGSQNVVINTPNGETLCGRTQAWDPMHPQVEYVMMFRGCGGGGKRTFTMEKRELP